MRRSRLLRRPPLLALVVLISLVAAVLVTCSNGLRAFVMHCRIAAKGGDLLVKTDYDAETWRSPWFEDTQSHRFIGFLHGAEIDQSTMRLLAEYGFARLSLAESTFSPKAIPSLRELEVGDLDLSWTNIDDAALSYLSQGVQWGQLLTFDISA